MAFRELPPRKSPAGPRKIRDGSGTVWQLREIPAKPGSMGTSFCVLLFEAPKERRWKPFIKGDLYIMSHSQLAHELKDAQAVPAGKAIPEYQPTDEPRALCSAEYEEGA